MPLVIFDPWHGEQGVFADTVIEQNPPPQNSRLLGPDGRPLAYEPPQKLGFDLTPRKEQGTTHE
jgi:hypothetical protein